MSRCFVIQPFDGGKFDKRFEDVFEPAIKAAGLEPYRVDRDNKAVIPIDQIMAEIESAEACLCDITTDNPNVWFELGYAIARKKEVILIAADERKTPYPFDVQHRRVIKYVTESSSDFDRLRTAIKTALEATMQKRSELAQVGSVVSVAKVEGLDQFEVAALIAATQNMDHPNDGASIHQVRRDMESAGFTKMATTLGLRSLIDKDLLQVINIYDAQAQESFPAYQPTANGLGWLFANKETLALRVEKQEQPPNSDDDIPF